MHGYGITTSHPTIKPVLKSGRRRATRLIGTHQILFAGRRLNPYPIGSGAWMHDTTRYSFWDGIGDTFWLDSYLIRILCNLQPCYLLRMPQSLCLHVSSSWRSRRDDGNQGCWQANHATTNVGSPSSHWPLGRIRRRFVCPSAPDLLRNRLPSMAPLRRSSMGRRLLHRFNF